MLSSDSSKKKRVQWLGLVALSLASVLAGLYVYMARAAPVEVVNDVEDGADAMSAIELACLFKSYPLLTDDEKEKMNKVLVHLAVDPFGCGSESDAGMNCARIAHSAHFGDVVHYATFNDRWE